MAPVLRLLACAVLLVMPGVRAAEDVLADPKGFLRDARENLSRSQQIQHRYAYKERRTQLHLNPFGRLGSGETLLFEVFPSPNRQLTYRRLIARNGQAVAAAEIARRDREYSERVREFARRREREDADEREARERDELLARTRAERMIEDVVRALEFTVARRDRREGRSMIVVTFRGNPGARPTTREGRIARSFKGAIWFDEAEREVAYVDAVAVEDIRFGGGFIARLEENTRATLTRREIAPDVWLPTELTFKGEGRALLFRRLVIDHAIAWFDYTLSPHPPGAVPGPPRPESSPEP